MFLVILSMRKVDYLIVGQGLAGSCLALELFKRDKSFFIIDNQQPHTASKVAAGLFNPITGRTNQPTWKAAEIFQSLHSFYGEAEQVTGEKFINRLPIYRPFLSAQEQMSWPAASNPWVARVFSGARFPEFLNDPFGGIEIHTSGFLNTRIFLEVVRKMMLEQGRLVEEVFDHSELQSGEKIQYKNTEAGKIIFCDGTDVHSNPFFGWTPIKKLKGELLTVMTKLPLDVIINRGIFAVPTGEPETFIMGSTYQHDLTPGNTPAGIHELVSRAKILFKNDFEIISQNWGHRPTTPDRRPLLGSHPEHKNICLFNGLGTKGVSLAPFFAVLLADWLEGKADLDNEVNIERFYSLYFTI